MPQETVPLRSETGEPLPLALEYVAWRVAGGRARLWLAGAVEAILDLAQEGGEIALAWWLALTPEEREAERQVLSLFAEVLARVQRLAADLAEMVAAGGMSPLPNMLGMPASTKGCRGGAAAAGGASDRKASYVPSPAEFLCLAPLLACAASEKPGLFTVARWHGDSRGD